jgi:hypothetical protein
MCFHRYHFWFIQTFYFTHLKHAVLTISIVFLLFWKLFRQFIELVGKILLKHNVLLLTFLLIGMINIIKNVIDLDRFIDFIRLIRGINIYFFNLFWKSWWYWLESLILFVNNYWKRLDRLGVTWLILLSSFAFAVLSYLNPIKTFKMLLFLHFIIIFIFRIVFIYFIIYHY